MLPALAAQTQGGGAVSADNLNTFVQGGGATCADLRGFIGLGGMLVQVTGLSAPNDGGFGTFYWNAFAVNPTDDGGYTTVVPSGTVGTGCWSRLLASVNAPYITVLTIAALKALPVAVLGANTPIFVEGYYAANDGGGGVFLSTTTNPGADNGGTIIHSNSSGWYFNRFVNGQPVSLMWFGSDPTGVVSSATQITNWLGVIFAPGSRLTGYAPGGIYADGGRVIDVGNRYATGFILYGDGADTTHFELTGGGWKFISTIGGGGFFYPQIFSMDLSCDAWGGPALEIGSADRSDAANGLKLENMRVTNSANTNSANCAIRLNVCVTFQFINVTTNCGSTSWTSDTQIASLRMYNAGIGTLQGSFSGAGIGVHLTTSGEPDSGFNYALNFSGDFEVNWYDIQCDSANSANNTISPGTTLVWTAGGAPFNCTQGIALEVNNCNISNTLVFGSGGAGYVGVIIRDYRINVSTPNGGSVPATTVYFKNITGFNVNILFVGGVITEYQIKDRNGGVVALVSNAASTGLITIPLDTECSIAVTYDVMAGQPGWVWYQR